MDKSCRVSFCRENAVMHKRTVCGGIRLEPLSILWIVSRIEQ